MIRYKFFCYCPNEGFEVFETLDEAIDDANERIQGYLDHAWSEDVTGVCAGKITHRAKMCDQVFPDGEIDEDGFDEAGYYWDPDWDYQCNYKMIAYQKPAPEVTKLVEALEEMIDVAERVDICETFLGEGVMNKELLNKIAKTEKELARLKRML